MTLQVPPSGCSGLYVRVLCRFFLEPKCLVAGVGRVAPELTYMKSCTLLDRALKLFRAQFPSAAKIVEKKATGDDSDPHHALDKRPYLKGDATKYSERVAKRCRNSTSVRSTPVSEIVDRCCEELTSKLHDCPQVELERWVQIYNRCALESEHDDSNRLEVLSCARVVVFHRCVMPDFLVSSEKSSGILTTEGKSEASSYCLAYLTSDAGVKELQPCFVKYFILMEWGQGLPTSRTAVVCPISYQTQDAEGDVFGQTVFRFDKTQGISKDAKVIAVEDIVRPFILVKTPAASARCMWRLVQFQGKLLGSFDDEVYWTNV